MKSAYELAMSRLEKAQPTVKLNDTQRREIAELDSQCRAKVAEKEIFLQGELQNAAGDPEAQEQLRRQLASEISRIQGDYEGKKERVRQGG